MYACIGVDVLYTDQQDTVYNQEIFCQFETIYQIKC